MERARWSHVLTAQIGREVKSRHDTLVYGDHLSRIVFWALLVKAILSLICCQLFSTCVFRDECLVLYIFQFSMCLLVCLS